MPLATSSLTSVANVPTRVMSSGRPPRVVEGPGEGPVEGPRLGQGTLRGSEQLTLDCSPRCSDQEGLLRPGGQWRPGGTSVGQQEAELCG